MLHPEWDFRLSTDGLHEAQLSSEVVYQGRLLEVRRDTVRLPDGAEANREYIVHPGAVVIVPILPNGDMLFERQYRYSMGKVFLELPAGKIDPGESIETTAIRELREETGYVAGRWKHLGTMHPCIGYSNERIEVFLAEDLSRVAEQSLDDGEFLEIFPLAPEKVREAIAAGVLTDAKTITAVYMAEVVGGKF